MYKFAATVLALALATTHGLPDDGHNVQKKDASKGLRGSVGRKLESDGLVCQDGLVCVCHKSCTAKWGTSWIEKCDWGAEHKSGGCKDCRECETTEAHDPDYDGPYNGPLSKKCEPRDRENRKGYMPCVVSTVKITEDGRKGGGKEIGGAFTKVCDGACFSAHDTPWATKCDVDYANGYQCSDCRECLPGGNMDYVDKVRGGEGDVCNADDKKRGPCYGAWKTPWEDKCKPDYVHRCEGCPECEFPAAVSKTSGKKDVFDSRCDDNPGCKNDNLAKCDLGYSGQFLCNACDGCPEKDD